MRLGQLVENIASRHERHTLRIGGNRSGKTAQLLEKIAHPIWNIEDDRFEAALDDWLGNPPVTIVPKALENGPLRGYTAHVLHIDDGMLIPPKPIPTLVEYTEERFVRELKEIGLPQEVIDSSLLWSYKMGRLSVIGYNSSIAYDGENCGLVNWCPHCDRLRMTTGPDGHIRYCYTCRGVTGPGNMA